MAQHIGFLVGSFGGISDLTQSWLMVGARDGVWAAVLHVIASSPLWSSCYITLYGRDFSVPETGVTN